MTLRKLIKFLLGVDGDPGDLERPVMLRIVRRREGGVVTAGYRLVPIGRVSQYRVNLTEPVLDIVIEAEELEKAKEVLV